MPATMTAKERESIDRQINRLRKQLDQDADIEGGGARTDHTNLLVGGTIGLAVVAVVAVLGIFAIRPDKDNTAMVATILGFLVPMMTGLLAAAVQQVHSAVNSRLTQLLRVTAEKNRAEGVMEGKGEVPATKADVPDEPAHN